MVTQTLQTNYYGTLQAVQEFLPLVRPGGRMVNVASIVGHLNSKYSPAIREQFASSASVADVNKLMQAFAQAVHNGTHEQEGWPTGAAYSVSKSGLIGATRAIAREEEKTGKGVLVNSCCPGYVNTDMTKGRGVSTVDQGAKTPVMLALADIGGKSGEFWTREKVSPSTRIVRLRDFSRNADVSLLMALVWWAGDRVVKEWRNVSRLVRQGLQQ